MWPQWLSLSHASHTTGRGRGSPPTRGRSRSPSSCTPHPAPRQGQCTPHGAGGAAGSRLVSPCAPAPREPSVAPWDIYASLTRMPRTPEAGEQTRRATLGSGPHEAQPEPRQARPPILEASPCFSPGPRVPETPTVTRKTALFTQFIRPSPVHEPPPRGQVHPPR